MTQELAAALVMCAVFWVALIWLYVEFRKSYAVLWDRIDKVARDDSERHFDMLAIATEHAAALKRATDDPHTHTYAPRSEHEEGGHQVVVSQCACGDIIRVKQE